MQYTPIEITNTTRLAGILRCESYLIRHLVNKTIPIFDVKMDETLELDKISENAFVYNPSMYLCAIKLPKRRKHLEFRTVYSVMPHFAQNALKVLKFYLNDLYFPCDCVHGFIKKRNIVTNAQQHLNKKLILNIDIKNFFESITIDKVLRTFLSLGFNDEIAGILSKITTFQDKLVAGFSTSPIIANLYCKDMDEELLRLSIQNNIIYTRYADDLTFSGERVTIISNNHRDTFEMKIKSN